MAGREFDGAQTPKPVLAMAQLSVSVAPGTTPTDTPLQDDFEATSQPAQGAHLRHLQSTREGEGGWGTSSGPSLCTHTRVHGLCSHYVQVGGVHDCARQVCKWAEGCVA